MLTRSEIVLALRPTRSGSHEQPRAARAAVRGARFDGRRYSDTIRPETPACDLASAAARDLVTTCRLTLAASIVLPFALGWLLAVAAL